MTICANIFKLKQEIQSAEKHFHRELDSVKLLAVTKRRSIDDIREAISCGQTCFGESYLQEAIPKIEALKDALIEWHFIGPIQSNKTKLIARYFDWVQSVDRIKIAERLHEARLSDMPCLNVCIEVNINQESSKAGAAPADVFTLAQKIISLSNLKLRGLMAIPRATDNFDEQRANFQQLKQLFDELNHQGFELDTLSMGMSRDFLAAIAEGGTMIRLGAAIFL